jgi:hypothetical protein
VLHFSHKRSPYKRSAGRFDDGAAHEGVAWLTHTRHVTAPRTLRATMINMNRLRELTAELGFIPATTDAAAIDGRE